MTTPESLPPEQVASLIDKVLRSNDPATVGLRRILRKKEDERSDFPVRGAQLEEFSPPGAEMKKLRPEERRVLELEKQLAELQTELARQKTAAAGAIQSAFAQGRKQGLEQGRTEGAATAGAVYDRKVEALQNRIGDFLLEIEKAKRDIFTNAEHVMLKLCCAMTGKIIEREVDERRDVILAVLKRALSYIGHHEKVVVRIAPGDFEQVSGNRDFWFPVSARLGDIAIEADERIEKGGCIIESNTGLIDARLGVQFGEIAGIVEKIWDETASAPRAEASVVIPGKTD